MSNTLDEMTMLLGEMVRKEKEAQPVALRVLDVRLEYAAKILALITEARIDERHQANHDLAQLEVKSLPTDDPELVYWQGYADAQLQITNINDDRLAELKENK